MYFFFNHWRPVSAVWYFMVIHTVSIIGLSALKLITLPFHCLSHRSTCSTRSFAIQIKRFYLIS
jgi:hypothetical protein